MFAYILKAPKTQPTAQTDEFFREFCKTPGLAHAFELLGTDGSDESLVVAVWENREAAEKYLNQAPLRRKVDQSIPDITRTMYDVLSSK